ncbi:MAG TPA: PAS-domain containing protein, partial [Lysobacter sp.]
VVDAQLRLVAWNRRYVELFGFPEHMLRVGRPIAELSAWALERMPHQGTAADALRRRLAYMRAGTPHLSERVFPDGSIVEIRGNPMPGGGFVATFTDVTAFRRAEAALILSNETLEQRVAERTTLLESAKREAERANDAKSRFLAAIGHDLMQPLHAAHLFTDALAQQLTAPAQRELAAQTRGALESTTNLLAGLLDMSRLEAGGLRPQPRDFPLAEVLDPLASEFRALAAERGLRFRYVRSRAWVHSDPQLLRRVLQNFLANAVRYTAHGTVLLGVRRLGGAVRIDVHDSGPGIPAELQASMFEEFRRGEGAPGQGLGLGLAIAERMAQLLHAPLSLHSRPGRGTRFGIGVPCAAAQSRAPAPVIDTRVQLPGTRVLILDNEPVALAALQRLLESWGCHVSAVRSGADAHAALAARAADVWLFDYHLDDDDTGVAVRHRLAEAFGGRPAVILSADRTDAVRRTVHEAGLPLLMKPLKPLALKSVLDRVLAASKRPGAV